MSLRRRQAQSTRDPSPLTPTTPRFDDLSGGPPEPTAACHGCGLLQGTRTDQHQPREASRKTPDSGASVLSPRRVADGSALGCYVRLQAPSISYRGGRAEPLCPGILLGLSHLRPAGLTISLQPWSSARELWSPALLETPRILRGPEEAPS